jgi:hypothetical protein
VGVRGEVELKVYFTEYQAAAAELGPGPEPMQQRRSIYTFLDVQGNPDNVDSPVGSYDPYMFPEVNLTVSTPVQLQVFLTVSLWAYRLKGSQAESSAPSGWALVDCSGDRMGVEKVPLSNNFAPRKGTIRVPWIQVLSCG